MADNGTIIACCTRCDLIEERADCPYELAILEGWIRDHATRHNPLRSWDDQPC